MNEHAGVYISVPFCKAKCTYCNFASGVFAPERMDRYVERVCQEIAAVREAAAGLGAELPQHVDTIFLGGGTPSLLSAAHMRNLFAALRAQFTVAPDAEFTLECAPGQLSNGTLAELLRLGMNRISFGVQSFVDAEAKSVGRLHTRDLCLAEIARMRAAGIEDINIDLIAGLPGQTAASWRASVDTAIATRVPHVSVYMLEVDEDSRLGREMLASGTRYAAASAPSEDETADLYSTACLALEHAGIHQYEISNFARHGHASRHNVKYWRREPYIGFGLDAHSMLRGVPPRRACTVDAIRWANTADLDGYLALEVVPGLRTPPAPPTKMQPERIGPEQSFEETLFLGLRMNVGISLAHLRADFDPALVESAVDSMQQMQQAGMLLFANNSVRLTAAGRMASNEVFSRLLVTA